ncbi:protein of unknown function [Candidatus Nitrosocosmicus franklandus]|uniref:Uncharacterized protein n=1 Tax=Candidatus Nitrosocosmicus franklandianus TaxID=1798806 RepID=A0A484I906_9ARCH|nr:protein of unknown function [Candidatus Nitrosocosmicus franklandus]
MKISGFPSLSHNNNKQVIIWNTAEKIFKTNRNPIIQTTRNSNIKRLKMDIVISR